MKTYLRISLLMILSIPLVKAQSRFYKNISGLSIPYQVNVEATSDGGWITGGTSFDGVKLIKFGKCGNMEWSKYYTCPATINCLELIVSKFGGYAIAGYYGSDPFNADPYLLKLDANGNVIFCKQFQASSSDHTYSLGEDNHGNFIINGNTHNGGTDFGHNFILKTDSTGNILWCKLYAMGGMWALGTVCNDGGVLRCGGHGDIYKIDSSGNFEWAKYGFWQARFKPKELSDGYIFPSYCSARGFIFKTDHNGNLIWRTGQYVTPSTLHCVSITSNENIVAINSSMVIEYDKTGKYLRHNRLQDPVSGFSPVITGICLSNDNTFILSGFGNQIFNGRIDQSLNSGCADFNAPLDTIAPVSWMIHDTIYSPGVKTFNPLNISITGIDFYPIEETACAMFDSIQFMTDLPDSVCMGESVNLSVLNSGYNLNWNWYSDNCGGDLIGTGTSVIVSPSETITYFVKGEGSCDTTACKPVTVNVKIKPEADFNASYIMNCGGITANLINESQNADSYAWTLNDGYSSVQENISHVLTQVDPITISLTAINNNGCRDTMAIIESASSLLDYFNISFPNVFSPNNDGVNDQFGIVSQVNLSDCLSITIYDRWGIEIFSSESNDFRWDGTTTSGLAVVPGTYFYVIILNNIEYNGQITLVE